MWPSSFMIFFISSLDFLDSCIPTQQVEVLTSSTSSTSTTTTTTTTTTPTTTTTTPSPCTPCPVLYTDANCFGGFGSCQPVASVPVTSTPTAISGTPCVTTTMSISCGTLYMGAAQTSSGALPFVDSIQVTCAEYGTQPGLWILPSVFMSVPTTALTCSA